MTITGRRSTQVTGGHQGSGWGQGSGMAASHRFVIQFGLQFLGIGDFSHRLHEVLLSDEVPVHSDRKHP